MDSHAKQATDGLQQRSKLSILLVDDEKDICTVYDELLTMHGFSVTTSSSPSDVLASFKKGDYDLAILDVKMPVLNGYELYEKLVAIDNNIRVIFMTAFYFTDSVFKEKHTELTRANYMVKPLDIPQLMETITEIMQSRPSALET